MIAIIDYGVGNLFSLRCSISTIGYDAVVTSDEKEIKSADHILLPGVGAFEDAARKLRDSGMAELVKEEALSGKPLLGICLGMQMLLEKSFEYGIHEGLGLIKGNVKRISEACGPGYKIPHIGWNALEMRQTSPLFKYINDGDYVYFVHSYYAADCDDNVIADTEYGARLTAAVQTDNVYGCQFHPEKSGGTGLNILRAFCEISGE